MNATIQCLCNIPNLINYFLDNQELYKEINDKPHPLTSEFCGLINHLWKFPVNNQNYYCPQSFNQMLSIMNPLFYYGTGNCQDLIKFLYETIHKEMNKVKLIFSQNQYYIKNQELVSFRNQYYYKNNSIFSKTFFFEVQEVIQCRNCHYTKSFYSIQNIIIFNLEKIREYMTKKHQQGFLSVKLQDCFEYNEIVFLTGYNQIHCNCCQNKSDGLLKKNLFNPPKVMTIFLERGQSGINFKYPLIINIDEFVFDKNCKNNNYELICVLSQEYETNNFIAICKSPIDKKWYKYDDKQVSNCEHPYSDLPYVLFYQKIEESKGIENIKK